MALDPNIALQVRGIELQNPIAQYGQIAQLQNAQNQNALAQYQLGAAQRSEAKDIARTNALASAGTDDAAISNALLKSGDLKGYAEFQKTRRETQKAEVDLADVKLKQSRLFLENVNTPEQYIAWHEANHKDPILGSLLASRGITADQSRARIMAAIQTPEGFQRLLNESKLGTEKFMEMNKPQLSTKDTGSQLVDRTFEPLTGKITSLGVTDKTMTPGETATNQIAQEQLGVSKGQLTVAQRNAATNAARLTFDKQKAEQPQFNAQAGGFIAPPTTENPEGVFIPAKGIQAAKDQSAAVKALQSAGYNVDTGEDNISKLISKSTSGGLQAGSAAALAFFGKSTEGRKAIAALEGTANQIATDLAGGKLGAGISNTDREFIVGALGDVANPNKTAEERLSGWNAAKQRMMLTGLIPPPKPSAPKADGKPAASPYRNLSNEELLRQLNGGK